MTIEKVALLIVGCLSPFMTDAAVETLTSPAKGVLCDIYVCANEEGISNELTRKYLGFTKEKKLAAQGDFNRTSFTYANGIYCNTLEKICRQDRYFGADGKPSGVVDSSSTKLLFSR